MAATGVGYVDPYSGTSRYTGGGPAANPGSTSAPERRPEDVLPVSAYLSFKQANVDALSKKVFELNASLAAGSDASLALTQEETKNLKDVVAFTSLPKAALPNPENVLSKEGWDVASLFAVLPKWPAAQRFPRASCLCSTLISLDSFTDLIAHLWYLQSSISSASCHQSPRLCRASGPRAHRCRSLRSFSPLLNGGQLGRQPRSARRTRCLHYALWPTSLALRTESSS
jgi:hypothetical protein